MDSQNDMLAGSGRLPVRSVRGICILCAALGGVGLDGFLCHGSIEVLPVYTGGCSQATEITVKGKSLMS